MYARLVKRTEAWSQSYDRELQRRRCKQTFRNWQSLALKGAVKLTKHFYNLCMQTR
jgi:hypothetical protein